MLFDLGICLGLKGVDQVSLVRDVFLREGRLTVSEVLTLLLNRVEGLMFPN